MAGVDLLAAVGRRRRPWLLAALVAGACASAGVLALGYRARVVEVAGPPASEPAATTPVRTGLRVRPLSDWLAEVAAEAGLGLVIAPEVGGEVAADFPERATWQERIAALARIHGFAFDVGDTLIEVGPLPLQVEERMGADDSPTSSVDRAAMAAADADLPASDHGAQAVACAEPEEAVAPPPPAYAVLRMSNARAADLEDVVTPALRATNGSVKADPASNALVVTGAAAAVAAARRLIAELDVARRRFLLEAQIVELSRSARSELGVQWSVDGDVGALVDFPAADAPREEAGIVVATDGAHDLRARIGALEAAGRVRIISRPRVVTVEGKPASIESVRILRVRFPDHTALVADGEDVSVSGSSRAVEEIPVGVSLIVEPALQGQGDVVLRIKAKSSTLGSPQPPDDIPEELSRMVDAEVVVGDGETAVLGGLRREGRSRSGAGVPVLRSVPLLGKLFGRHVDESEGEELIVLVTPHLLP